MHSMYASIHSKVTFSTGHCRLSTKEEPIPKRHLYLHIPYSISKWDDQVRSGCHFLVYGRAISFWFKCLHAKCFDIFTIARIRLVLNETTFNAVNIGIRVAFLCGNECHFSLDTNQNWHKKCSISNQFRMLIKYFWIVCPFSQWNHRKCSTNTFNYRMSWCTFAKANISFHFRFIVQYISTILNIWIKPAFHLILIMFVLKTNASQCTIACIANIHKHININKVLSKSTTTEKTLEMEVLRNSKSKICNAAA